MSKRKDEKPDPLAVVADEAFYTLGLHVSQVSAQGYDEKKKSHLILTIGFPSQGFADGIKKNMLKAVITRDSPKTDNEISIILPAFVEKVESNEKGVNLVFEKAVQAETWDKYSGIWSRKHETSRRLSVSYKWAHNALVVAAK